MKISATIIAFNEADNISAACQSLHFADEIIVVDSGSTDNTKSFARNCGARVIEQAWLGFGRQKQFAAEQAQFDWIFSLDADERVSPELAQEILKIKNGELRNAADGYRISRRTKYMNRWVRGGGWYPDWQLRFYNRTRGRWKDVLIHESIKMNQDAIIKVLKKDILHFSIPDAAYHNRMIAERYAPLAAQQMFERRRTTSPARIACAGSAAFLQSFVLKNGWRDGLAGFCIARFAAHHAFLKHLLLWEMQQKKFIESDESSK